MKQTRKLMRRPGAIVLPRLTASALGVIALCFGLILALGGCIKESAPASTRDEVRVQVTAVGFDPDAGDHYLQLEDASRRHSLSLAIGDDEARAISLELHGVEPARPLTYDLMRSIILRTGNRVDRVVIDDLHDEIYYAQIHLDHDRYVIDSRPSDAVAIAMAVHAPIYVARALMQEAAHGAAGAAVAPPRTASALGLTVEELTPDLAEYFHVTTASGVLVADLGAAADRSGLARGDIITELDGHRVEDPAQFLRQAKAVQAGSEAALIFDRKGQTHAINLPLERAGATP